MSHSEDLLAQYQADLEASAFDEEKFGIDRRHFVFLSLAAAGTAAAGGTTPINNNPPGTGALMEKVVRERGAAAFNRGTYQPEKWSGALPTSDDAIAFLPAHRLSALLKAHKVTT